MTTNKEMLEYVMGKHEPNDIQVLNDYKVPVLGVCAAIAWRNVYGRRLPENVVAYEISKALVEKWGFERIER